MQKQPRRMDRKVAPIGNSRGIRLPKSVLNKYAITDTVVLEEREDGILLRSKQDERLSWEETYKEMAPEREDWSDLDVTLADGLKVKIPGRPARRALLPLSG
jgi:antitoxin MazE